MNPRAESSGQGWQEMGWTSRRISPVEVIDTKTAIVCVIEPVFYISDRRGCLWYILETYRNKIPVEVIDRIDAMELVGRSGKYEKIRRSTSNG